MGKNYKPHPSFLKLLMEEDFRKRIRIPNAFTRDFKNKLSKKCMLKCTAAKKSWSVKIRRKGKNFYICKDAWPDFVKHHQLKYGDCLLFWLVKERTFEVIIYGSDCTRKFGTVPSDDDAAESESLQEEEDDIYGDDQDFDLPNIHDSSKKAGDKKSRNNINPGIRVKEEITISDGIEEEQEEEDEETDYEYKDYHMANLENPYFVKTLKPSCKNQMAIPAGFAKETKLDPMKTVYVLSEDNRKWPVKIWRGGGIDNMRFVMTEGWRIVVKICEMKMGDRYKFTLLRNQENVFRVEHIPRSY